MVGLAVLGGIGFTVSLLIGELAFGAGSDTDDHAEIGILIGSLLAALIAAVILCVRARVYRRICEQDVLDTDHDGMSDAYQRPD